MIRGGSWWRSLIGAGSVLVCLAAGEASASARAAPEPVETKTAPLDMVQRAPTDSKAAPAPQPADPVQSDPPSTKAARVTAAPPPAPSQTSWPAAPGDKSSPSGVGTPRSAQGEAPKASTGESKKSGDASRKEKGSSAGASTKAEASKTEAASSASWTELWSVPVGSTAADDGSPGLGQIAARGPLILVASRGVPHENDATDGVHVVDGREGVSAADRTVRIIPSPQGGLTDAVGVAVDGDFVVFGTYGGLVTEVRLDGVVKWVSGRLPASTRPGLPALVDVNGDGVRDALVPLVPTTACAGGEACGPEWDEALVALDGVGGKVLWRRNGGRELHERAQGTGSDCRERLLSVDVKAGVGRIICAAGYLQTLVSDSFRLSGGADVAADTPDEGNPFGVSADGFGADGRSAPLFLIGDSLAASGVTFHLKAPAQSIPSLAAIDGNGVWDVLIVTDKLLQVFATGARGKAGTLWRGDLAATGAPASFDSPADYRSSLGPRDRLRWLRRSEPPTRDSFIGITDASYGAHDRVFREKVTLENDPKGLVIDAQCDCGKRYGSSEGTLVVKEGATWEKVPDAPWPVVALSCVEGDLVVEQARGARFRMSTPLPVKTVALSMLALLVAAAGLAVWYTSKKSPLPPDPEKGASYDKEGSYGRERSVARRAIAPDGPRTRREEAHASQARLLDGLLNVLDNDDTRPPVTIALFGPWGSGKSSMMQMLRSELQATGRYIDVWFNAWRFQREPELAPALLQSIVDEVARQSDWVTRVAVVWDRVRRATARDILLVVVPATVVLLLLAVSVHSVTHGKFTATNTSATIASVLLALGGTVHRGLMPLLKVFSLEPAKLLASESGKERIQFVREFSGEFERISRRLPDGTRLIVFIDDLDRCAPDRIVNVLETLSMLADTGCGFFVLAIDPVTVRRAIELTYKDLLRVARRESPKEASAFGTKYLEKMITLGVNVPVLPAADVSPDGRLDAPKESPGPLSWFLARVLPEPPLLVTVAVLSLAVFLGARRADVVTAGLELGASYLVTPEDSAAPPGSASSALPEHVDPSSPAPSAQVPAGAISATPPVQKPPEDRAAASKPPDPGPAKVEAAAAISPPAVVESPLAPSPSLSRRRSEWIVLAIGVLLGAPLLGIVLLVVGDARRRGRINGARPMGTDSIEFAGALAATKKTLVETPRNVVRFTNLSRFLYSVVAARREPHPVGWESSFFASLAARWTGAPEPPSPTWLMDEMDQWFPRGAPGDGTTTDGADSGKRDVGS